LATDTGIDLRRLNRIRWRCRRGLLENDLVLARFLDQCGEVLTDSDIASLDALLDMADNALWDVIAGRTEPAPELAAFVARLRAA
jgi:antitoxin CptB